MSEDASLDNEAFYREQERLGRLDRLRELSARYGPPSRVSFPGSTAADHWLATGHMLASGCCLNSASTAIKET